MAILGELATELVSMFAGEKRLTLAVLTLITAAALLVDFVGLNQLIAGTVLLVGCPVLLIESVCRSARTQAFAARAQSGGK
jgi:hypothetical protein